MFSQFLKAEGLMTRGVHEKDAVQTARHRVTVGHEVLHLWDIGIMGKKMETTTVYWGYIGIMEKRK